MITLGIYVKVTEEAGETSAARCKDIQVEERNEKSSHNKESHLKAQLSDNICWLIFRDAEFEGCSESLNIKETLFLCTIQYVA